MNTVIDLRSDTVTKPTQAMIDRMSQAEVGDDVLGDDPTVRRLEELVAEETGMESALFVPSGTMGNQIAVAVHTNPGDAFLVDEEAHIVYYEGGMPAILSGAMPRSVPSNQGRMSLPDLEKRFTKKNVHTPGVSLLCLENTHNRSGGFVLDVETMAEYRTFSKENGVPVHLDGARVWNAAIHLGVEVKAITAQVDTVCVCLSKGLGAPVGSVLCGPDAFIEEAKFWRKRLGGGMRQSGILAAAGIVALEQMVYRLHDDHRNAKQFASLLQGIPGLTVQEASTNFTMVKVEGMVSDWLAAMKSKNLLALSPGPGRIRFVWHHQVSRQDAERAASIMRDVAKDIMILNGAPPATVWAT